MKVGAPAGRIIDFEEYGIDSGHVLIRFTLEHGGGCTLARFFDKGNGAIRLQKDNPKYEPIPCDREDIQSVAVAVEQRVKL